MRVTREMKEREREREKGGRGEREEILEDEMFRRSLLTFQ